MGTTVLHYSTFMIIHFNFIIFSINLLVRAATRYRSEGLAQINTMNYTVISVTEQPLLTNILVDIQSAQNNN